MALFFVIDNRHFSSNLFFRSDHPTYTDVLLEKYDLQSEQPYFRLLITNYTESDILLAQNFERV